MLDINFATSQAWRLSGLDFFPQAEEGIMELALALQTADLQQYAVDVIDDWLGREQVTSCPKPGQLRVQIYDRNQLRIKEAEEQERRRNWKAAEQETRAPTTHERDRNELRAIFQERLRTVDQRFAEQPEGRRLKIKADLETVLGVIERGSGIVDAIATMSNSSKLRKPVNVIEPDYLDVTT